MFSSLPVREAFPKVIGHAIHYCAACKRKTMHAELDAGVRDNIYLYRECQVCLTGERIEAK